MIKQRKEGESGTFFEDSPDMLTILTKHEFFAGQEEKIIDEIVGLFAAGSKTVQTTTANLICYLEKHPQVKSKLQNEIDSKIGPIQDDIKGKFNKELAEEFEYLRDCFFETLRIEAPVAQSAS